MEWMTQRYGRGGDGSGVNLTSRWITLTETTNAIPVGRGKYMVLDPRNCAEEV
jgi:hypothetical protein